MQRLLFKILAPAFVFATASVSDLPASTFGGSTGPRQGADENLPTRSVDSNTYRRLKGRVESTGTAPLTLPPKPEDADQKPRVVTVIMSVNENIIESNKEFVVVPME